MKDRIYELMKAEDFTQKKFASELGLSEGTLSNIFNGRTNPSSNVLSAIHSRFPEVNIAWLMFGDGEMFLSPQDSSPTPSEDQEGLSAENEVQNPAFFPEETQPLDSEMPGITFQTRQEVYPPTDFKQKQIAEIRVFYDDGTFETFSKSS